MLTPILMINQLLINKLLYILDTTYVCPESGLIRVSDTRSVSPCSITYCLYRVILNYNAHFIYIHVLSMYFMRI